MTVNPGIVVPSRDPMEWAETITRLLLDTEEHARLSAGGLRRVEGQDWLSVSERLADVYEAMISAGVVG